MGRVLLRVVDGLARAGLWVLVGAPLAALALGVVVEFGPGGRGGTTAFPLGLTLFDPFVWTCAGHSLLAAGAVAAGSLGIGVAAARLMSRWRFWGRRPLAALACVPLAVPPLFGAIGLSGLLGRAGLGLDPGAPEGWGGWLALIWVGLAYGVPRVAWSAAGTLERIEPDWEDAARAVGASGGRLWRTLLWPIVRPGAARAAAEVFTLMVLEPGAPWVLGLRRSLAFQVVEAATSPSPSPARAASLAMLGLALAVAGRLAIRSWGRSRPGPLPGPAVARPLGARGLGAAGLLLATVAGTALALGPILALVRLAFDDSPQGSIDLINDSHRVATHVGVVARSVGLGLAVGSADLLLALAIAARRRRLDGPSRARDAGDWPRRVPPLSLAVGVWLLPALLRAPAEAGLGPLSRALRNLADGLDPTLAPAWLLAWSLAVVRLPWLTRTAEHALGRARPELVEAAMVLGARPARAWRQAVLPGLAAGLIGPWAVSVALAASDTASALVLTPTRDSQTLGPAIARLAATPGDRPTAAALAVLAAAINAAALGLAAGLAGRPDRPPTAT